MEIKEIQKRKTEMIIDVICDSCGKSCKVDQYKVDNESRVDNAELQYQFEFMTLESYWGTHTDKKDYEKWTAQICEKCVDDKLSFIKFKKSDYTFERI